MPESVQKSVQNSASIPQPHRGEIEIDGERLGYALVECDVRSGEQRQCDAARGALAMAGKLGLAAPTMPTTWHTPWR